MALRTAQVVSVLDALTTPAGALSPQSSDPALSAAVAAARSWVNGAQVVGYGVGTKDPERAGELALKVYVRQKRPESELPAEQRIPGRLALPGRTAVVTDVEEIGQPVLQTSTGRVRPLLPGSSIGQRRDLGAGTLGCFVYANGTRGPAMILSNSHVLADCGLARRGAAICQPGVADGGGSDDVVGRLTDYVAFNFDAGFLNTCDAAVAEVSSTIAIDATVAGIGLPVFDATSSVRIGSVVQINGRASGHALGRVKDRHFRTTMTYPRSGGTDGPAGFRDQVLCTRYSEHGDSGSLVCDRRGRAVGLHWAGSDTVSIYSPIAEVFAALKVSLWPPP